MSTCGYKATFVCLVAALSRASAETPKPGEPVRVSIKSAVDGTTQHYVAMLPKDYKAGETLNLLVSFHGAGGDGWEPFKHPGAICRATRDVAAKYRLILVGPDYRGPLSWMGPGADDDVVQIIRETKARYKIGKVIVVGGSMGGAAALTFTALHPELVDGVASLCGFASLRGPSPHSGSIASSFGGTPVQKPEEYRKRSAELYPEKFTMPVAIWTGGQDSSVPPESAMRLARVLKSKNTNRVLHIHRENEGHAPSYDDALAAYEFVVKAVLSPSK